MFFDPMTASEAAKLLKATMIGKDMRLLCLRSIDNTIDSSLSFSLDPNLTKKAKGTVICSEEVSSKATLILSKKPKEDFVKVATYAERFNAVVKGKTRFIHPTAVINNDPDILIHIGKNVRIGPNCSIGFDGFGYVDIDGEWINFPHVGGVIIEDNVEIGANVCIDRGSLSNTILRKGVKIDNLVHIAHNVEIGENTLVVCQSMFGGSTRVGKNVWIGPGVTTLEWITIGDNALIGMGSVVTRDIRPGWIAFGSPAKEVRKRD